MPERRPLYTQRRFLRALERAWTRVEILVNRLSTAETSLRPYNPLYHLGTLTILLLIILTITGIYLTIFYRPGTERAYETVAGISATWLGSMMRSAHRYAADGLILMTLLHAVKMLISDRFWGNRWLAWISGWAMLVLFWVIGVMGYWLVWDEGAQWLTEYAIDVLQGPFALSFLGPEIAARTFSLFVIVLFLHIFLPILIVVGIIIHALRLTRVRLWTPRWLTIETGLVLIILSAWRPVTSTLPADLDRLVDTIPLDWWYMGFLPLASQWGNPLFWGLSLLVVGALSTLPWLARGRHPGPATITNPSCTGCALCARECPFDAIEMLPRNDKTRYKSVALIHPTLCTGCGICVGTCSTSGVELDTLHSNVLRQDIKRELAQAQTADVAPVAVFTCDRHKALASLPGQANGARVIPGDAVTAETAESIRLLQAKEPARVQMSTWQRDNGDSVPILLCAMPCVGMLHPQWVQESLEHGAQGALVLSCPTDDCSFREGPHWVSGRLQRRRSMRQQNVHYLEATPGHKHQIEKVLLAASEPPAPEAQEAETAVSSIRNRLETAVSGAGWLSQARYMLAGLAVLLLALGASLLLEQPASNDLPAQGLIRVAINHGGELIAASDELPPEVLEKLPPNVDPAQVLGGERFPVRLRVTVDGRVVLEETYQPRGLRHEGAVYGLANWWLAPGEHQVEIWMMDDGSEWQPVFADTVIVETNGVRTLIYDESEGVFVRRQKQ